MKPTPWTAQGTHLLEDTHLCQSQLFRWTAYFDKLKGVELSISHPSPTVVRFSSSNRAIKGMGSP